MVAGFLGVVIGLERAVAVGWAWGFGAPALAAAGGLALLAGAPIALAAGLFVASSVLLLAVFVRLYLLSPEWAGGLLVLGVALWLVGNVLWLVGTPLSRVVPWWAGFLVVTIA